MVASKKLDLKLQQSLLLWRPRQDDKLQLSDTVLRAALEGSRPLSAAQAMQLQASPITLRRFRQLSACYRREQAHWRGSSGIVLAADSATPSDAILHSLDQFWQLQLLFLEDHWQVILRMRPSAPFAAMLQQQKVEVCDGAGQVILQGLLDQDGELEGRWPFSSAPLAHFKQAGGNFHVRAAHTA